MHFSRQLIFKIQTFFEILPGIQSDYQTFWIKIRSNILSGLTWSELLQKLLADDTSVHRVKKPNNVCNSISKLFTLCVKQALYSRK